MFTVYVLESLRNNKRYVGFTSKPIEIRLKWHAQGLTAWTRQNGPFTLKYKESFDSKKQAQRREKYFKTGQGRATLGNLMGSTQSECSVSARKRGGLVHKTLSGRTRRVLWRG